MPFSVAILLLLLLVTACGYRGPLYLPGESPPQQEQDAASGAIPGELPAGEETVEPEEEEEGETLP